jgi:hypothetical protein
MSPKDALVLVSTMILASVATLALMLALDLMETPISIVALDLTQINN